MNMNAIMALMDVTESFVTVLSSCDKEIAMAALGVAIDTYCAKNGYDENQTWKDLFEVHSEVNNFLGDMRA